MDEALPVHQEAQTRAIIIRSVADYLRKYPQDLIDATRSAALSRFRPGVLPSAAGARPAVLLAVVLWRVMLLFFDTGICLLFSVGT